MWLSFTPVTDKCHVNHSFSTVSYLSGSNSAIRNYCSGARSATSYIVWDSSRKSPVQTPLQRRVLARCIHHWWLRYCWKLHLENGAIVEENRGDFYTSSNFSMCRKLFIYSHMCRITCSILAVVSYRVWLTYGLLTVERVKHQVSRKRQVLELCPMSRTPLSKN